MRHAAAHASTLQRHGDILVLQQMQLGSIQHDVSDGNSRLYNQLQDLKDHRNASKGLQDPQCFREPQNVVAQASDKRYFSNKNRSSMRFRLPLMGWLSGRTWEIAVSQSQASWILQVQPINFRAPDTIAFRYVREGNITAVDKLLRAGELSIWDVTTDDFSHSRTLLEVSIGSM